MGSVLRTAARPLPGTSTAGQVGPGGGVRGGWPHPQHRPPPSPLGARPRQGWGAGSWLGELWPAGKSEAGQTGLQLPRALARMGSCPVSGLLLSPRQPRGSATEAQGALALSQLGHTCPLFFPPFPERPHCSAHGHAVGSAWKSSAPFRFSPGRCFIPAQDTASRKPSLMSRCWCHSHTLPVPLSPYLDCVTPSGSSPGPLPAASMSRNLHLRRHWAEMVCVLRKP